MIKGVKGTIVKTRPELLSGRLRIVASVKSDAGEVLEAQMPDREVSAILPRSVLLGGGTVAPVSLLETVAPIVARMSDGRRVRVWSFKERWFLSFQPWRSVRFVGDADGEERAQDREAVDGA
ncbi:MAG: hypothetical protein ABSF77_05575 [Spirochaetia bacterium]|jgi:hypothetical protein